VKDDDRKDPDELRSRMAELERLRASLGHSDRLLHELRVHQIELDIQNRGLLEAQEQLELSRQKYVDLYDFAPVAYLTLEPDGTILEANLAAARMLGYDHNMLLNRRLQMVVALSDPLLLRSALRRAVDQKKESRTELILRTAGQESYTVELLVSPGLPSPDRLKTRVRVALIDVSSRAAAEQSLRFFSQVGARLSRIQLAGPRLVDELAGAGATGIIDGCWVEVDGEEAVAWRTDPLRRKMNAEQLEALRHQLRAAAEQTRSTASAVSGRWNPQLAVHSLWPAIAAWVCAPLTIQGEVRGMVALLRQIASDSGDDLGLELAREFGRRASMLLENAHLLKQAEEATRAREEILAVLAHDLSNTLFAFRLHAQRGLARGGDYSARALAAIARGTQWLLGLVRTVLDTSGNEGEPMQLKPQRSNLSQVLESACALQQVDADERRIALQREWPEELVLDVDEERLLQVMFNLVNNAVKFTPSGGRVEVGAARDAGEVRLWVRDSGPGLSPSQLEQVFERGWQAEPKSGGKGLGLYIARRIVEAHGGRLWAASGPGQGTTFVAVLPAGGVESAARQDAAPVSS
jgi:PAS domain S-box-containing protein